MLILSLLIKKGSAGVQYCAKSRPKILFSIFPNQAVDPIKDLTKNGKNPCLVNSFVHRSAFTGLQIKNNPLVMHSPSLQPCCYFFHPSILASLLLYYCSYSS